MKPFIADIKSKRVTLEVGKQYSFCTCGKSVNQPFCDGAHAKIENQPFAPMRFTAEKPEVSLCCCKQSKNLPFCDGSHKELTEADIGTSE